MRSWAGWTSASPIRPGGRPRRPGTTGSRRWRWERACWLGSRRSGSSRHMTEADRKEMQELLGTDPAIWAAAQRAGAGQGAQGPQENAAQGETAAPADRPAQEQDEAVAQDGAAAQGDAQPTGGVGDKT